MRKIIKAAGRIMDILSTWFLFLIPVLLVGGLIWLAVDWVENYRPVSVPQKTVEVIIDKQGNEIGQIITRTER